MAEITNDQLLKILRAEFVPALGCTEPVACALACAKCCEELGNIPESIEVLVSGNIFKNGMGVGIPGTGMIGLPIAAALGAICGKTEYGLEVLKDINDENLPLGKQMLQENRVTVKLKENAPDKLYAEAFCKYGEDTVKVVIVHAHTNIVLIEKNGKIIFEKKAEDNNNKESNKPELSVKRIWDYIHEVPFEDIKFILDGVAMNKNISNSGLENEYGLQVGRTLKENIDKGLLENDLLNYCLTTTTAASDARMDGCPLPVMTNSGSGNQGITTYLPVVAAAEKLQVSEEKLARAIAFSNLIAAHIHSYMGHLSALCGVIIAGTGAASGITYLLDGNYERVVNTIKTMGSNLTGMMCDGAKQGCALKVYSAVSAAVQSALLSKSGLITRNDGIIVDDIEQTIKNIGKIGSEGMAETDNMILKIMTQK